MSRPKLEKILPEKVHKSKTRLTSVAFWGVYSGLYATNILTSLVCLWNFWFLQFLLIKGWKVEISEKDWEVLSENTWKWVFWKTDVSALFNNCLSNYQLTRQISTNQSTNSLVLFTTMKTAFYEAKNVRVLRWSRSKTWVYHRAREKAQFSLNLDQYGKFLIWGCALAWHRASWLPRLYFQIFKIEGKCKFFLYKNLDIFP